MREEQKNQKLDLAEFNLSVRKNDVWGIQGPA